MPEKTPSNVKVYDRPEQKGPPLMMVGIAIIAILLAGFLLYKMLYHPATPSVRPQVGLISSLAVNAGPWAQIDSSLAIL